MSVDYDMDSVPASELEQVMECLAEALSEYRTTFSDFPQEITNKFTGAAVRMMAEATSEQDVYDRLAQLMVTNFLAGRVHAERGYPSPIGRQLGADIEIPDDLRPPSR